MRDFRELKVWHKAHQATLEVESLPRDTDVKLNEQVAEVKRMLSRFILSLSSTG